MEESDIKEISIAEQCMMELDDAASNLENQVEKLESRLKPFLKTPDEMAVCPIAPPRPVLPAYFENIDSMKNRIGIVGKRIKEILNLLGV